MVIKLGIPSRVTGFLKEVGYGFVTILKTPSRVTTDQGSEAVGLS